jgi:tyrosyl-tRNA synthetase
VAALRLCVRWFRVQLEIGNRQSATYPWRVSILEELQWRGLVADCTDTVELTKKLSAPITLYCGFDPTADSLHVGNLVPLLALRRFQLLGHHPIAVAGGATGSIGDPSGKTAERQLLTKEILDHNIASVKVQLAKLLDFETKQNPARLVDNASWTAGISFLDFLRDIGKHFSVNQMVAKESVRARMEDRDVGISYTEFSYMLLQAFDFMVLAREQNCELQIGGSDQWGNITAGIELTRKKLGRQVFGLTLPLITNTDGSKFGKTAAGAIWLDPKRTSGYKFYQFWINTADADVIRYLKYFTFLTKEEIELLEKQHTENPGARMAHRTLAKSATILIHGIELTEAIESASEALFGTIHQKISPTIELSELKANISLEEILKRSVGQDEAMSLLDTIVADLPNIQISKTKLEGSGIPLIEILVEAKLCQSKGQARKEIEGGGIYVNNHREANVARLINLNNLLFGNHILLRKGKKNYVVVTAK